MWVCRLEVWHENCIYLTNSSKHNVIVSIYPLSSHLEGRYRYLTHLAIINGKKEDVAKFIESIRKDKRCLQLQGSGNFYLMYLKMENTDRHTSYYYTSKIFFFKPIIHNHGSEEWYFGVWERETATNLLKIFKKHFHVKLISIKEEESLDFFLPQVMPKMTEKQKLAMQIAIRNGYYAFPRKTDLASLAKIMGVSRVTFQEHLRKAENRILPHIFGES